MREFKKDFLTSLFVGSIALTVWVILSLVSLESLLFLIKSAWFCVMFVFICIVCLLPTYKSKGMFMIGALALVTFLGVLGWIIGLDVLGYLGFPAGLEMLRERWLIYPIVGLLIFSLINIPIMGYCVVEAENTIKARWKMVAGFMIIMLTVAAFMVAGYFIVNAL